MNYDKMQITQAEKEIKKQEKNFHALHPKLLDKLSNIGIMIMLEVCL